MMTRYVLVGNSVAAVTAAEAIRSHDADGSITMISPEPYDAYSRPAITYYIADKISMSNMRYRGKDFYQRNNINKLFERSVVSIDTQSMTVELDNGKKQAFDKLLLATGGEPLLPPIPGLDKAKVFTCTSFDEAKAIKSAIKPDMSAVVIGGGLIGLKVAEALVYRGLKVTIVELLDRVLAPILDKKSAKVVESYLAEKSIDVITGAAAVEIVGETGEGPASSVVLNNGIELAADIVIMAAGVRPRIGYVGNSVKTGRGIRVDRFMRTSNSNIFAAGDVTESLNMLTGSAQLNPLWPSAYREGRVAGLNMAGIKTPFEGNISMNSVPLLGLPIISIGIFDASGDPDLRQIEFSKDGIYRKLVLKGDVLKGAVFIGAIERSGIALSLIREGTPWAERSALCWTLILIGWI